MDYDAKASGNMGYREQNHGGNVEINEDKRGINPNNPSHHTTGSCAEAQLPAAGER